MVLFTLFMFKRPYFSCLIFYLKNISLCYFYFYSTKMSATKISPIFTDKKYEAWNRILLSLKNFFKEVQDLFQTLIKYVRKENIDLDIDQEIKINDIYHRQYSIQDYCNSIIKTNDVLKEQLEERDQKSLEDLNSLLFQTSKVINDLNHHILSYY